MVRRGQQCTTTPLTSKADFPRSNDGVRLVVGEGRSAKSIIVNARLLCTRSAFFNKALSGTWKESQQRRVELPEDHFWAVRIYIEFLRTQDWTATMDLEIVRRRPRDFSFEFLALSWVYVFAEKVIDVKTKNATVRQIVEVILETSDDKQFRIPVETTVQAAYSGTPPNSLLRKLLVELYTPLLPFAGPRGVGHS